MGLYATYVFPRFMDWAMSGPRFQEQRKLALDTAQGTTLEIGFGTGLNLPHYPTGAAAGVTSLTALDPARLLPRTVMRRVAGTDLPVTFVHCSAEQLPFEDERFDCVVSTWTLCTIPDAIAALQEVRRVLKPEGRYLFLEHGRSRDPRVATWQDRLNPLQRIIGCGCNLNRPIDRLIEISGLKLDRLERYSMPALPRLVGEMYRGAARPDERRKAEG
jgi:ubiquinone/menaquinone biosynthesis C-methylase UbiE